MLSIYDGDGDLLDEEKSHSRGQPLAWVCKRGPDTLPMYTIFAKGADFVEDDLPHEKDGEGISEDNTPHDDQMLPASFYSRLYHISPFNKDLLRRAIRLRDANILDQARPAKQATVLGGFFQTAQDHLAKQQGRFFVLRRDEPTAFSELKSKRKHPDEDADVDEPMEVPYDGGDVDVIVPIPLKETFQTCVFGPTNVGKTYWAATTLCRSYEYYYPEKRIMVFSFFEHDPAFDHLNVTYVPITEDMHDRPPHVSQFTGSLLVFDDIESYPPALRDIVSRFRDQALQVGRKHDVSVIAIAHEIFGGHATKSTILECEQVVIFNQGLQEPIIKLLHKKYGLEKDVIKYITSLKTRWVCLKRSYPQAIICPQSIRLI
jgi:hypothetical protein